MTSKLKFLLLCMLLPCCVLAQSVDKTTITLCWDTSLSMQERQLDKELAFLDSLFIAQNVSNVRLLIFANDVQEKKFTNTADDWSALKQELSRKEYDGTANYQKLNGVTKSGTTIVFTDANKVLGNHNLSLDKGDILVNSSTKADYKTLKLWEFVNRITLLDFTDTAKKNKQENKVLEGFVYLDGKSISNVLIHSSSGVSFLTDRNGRFQYKAAIGDTLSIKRAKNIVKELVIDNSEQELKFFLDSNVIALDEVTVSEERLQELDMVNVGHMSIEKKKVGFTVYEIPEERISEIEGTITDVLQEVPGLMIGNVNPNDPRGSGLSSAVVRGKNSLQFDTKVLVVIDGTPIQKSRNFEPRSGGIVEQGASYSHINPQNIKSIKVLKGLAATNLFGSEGAGGVVLITTKTATFNRKTSGAPIDQALLTNNIFEGKLVSIKGQLNTTYIKEFKKAKDVKSAYEIYLDQRKQYLNDFWYFIDVSDYFRTANANLANKILSNVLELPFGYEELRTLLLKYVEIGQVDMAMAVVERMLKEHPKKIQSHLDAALVQKQVGNFQVAAELLNGMLTGTLNPDIDFSPLKKVASTELRNIVNQQQGKLDLSKIDANYKNNLTYNARLRFDWASPKNEFILKFVNPQKRFFDWKHSSTSDKKRIIDEIQNGFSTEQFELVGDITTGKWGIYITNLLPKDSNEPYWVKCTVDYNFGKSNQRSEEKLIRLNPTEDKEQLFFEFVVN